MRSLLPFLALLSACAPDPASPPATDPDGQTNAAKPSAPAAGAADEATRATAAAPAGAASSTRRHAYTALDTCKTLRQSREEMPMVEVECPGPADYRLRILDSDSRQVMTVVDPGGGTRTLDTARIGGGGFSSFGPTAEWRGDAPGGADGALSPDSLVVRYQVAERPYPAPEVSYLLAIRLTPQPCIVAVVPPGPGQNDSARAAADRQGACRAAR